MAETRVEKYRAYREEIQNLSSDSDLTTQKKTSDRVNKLLESQEGVSSRNESLSLDEMINAYEIYDKGIDSEESPLLVKAKRKHIYVLVSLITCFVLIGLTIIFAIIAFGGK